MDDLTPETGATETATAVPDNTPETAPLSVMDHAKQFGADTAPPETDTPAEQDAREHHSAQQKREKDSGKFADGKTRHRAKSQQASPEDVPRIRELTGKLRAAEDELTRLRASHAPPAQIARAEAKVEQATPTDTEPQETDEKYQGDYGKYLIDHARWATRDEIRQERQREQQQQRQAKVQASHRQLLTSWGERVEAAKAKYPDFEQIAYGPTRIPPGSPADAWIMEHKTGADLLYYLQSHPEEQDEILRLSVLDQVERLALLAQRFSSSSPESAGSTGAATGRVPQRVLPPRPPTPVRTEAQNQGSSPPPLDGSLSVLAHAKRFTRRY